MTFLFLIFAPVFGCSPLKQQALLPAPLYETSGMLRHSADSVWIAVDSGTPTLYLVGLDGTIQRTIEIRIDGYDTIRDWEALAQSKQRWFIGDMGNNANKRKDLQIFQIDPIHHQVRTNAATIPFSYSDQNRYPPPLEERTFDVEAMIAIDDVLYLFSKNWRSRPFDNRIKLYRLDPQQPEPKAQLLSRFDSKGWHWLHSITDAALRPDEKVLVLLSHGHIHVFWDFTAPQFFSGKHKRISLWHLTQKEAVTFLDDYTLLIGDEQSKLGPARLYTLSLERFLKREGL